MDYIKSNPPSPNWKKIKIKSVLTSIAISSKVINLSHKINTFRT